MGICSNSIHRTIKTPNILNTMDMYVYSLTVLDVDFSNVEVKTNKTTAIMTLSVLSTI